ncbi:hypothetical protein [Corynebacterium alimapuense]|uniref:Uncharacterized protein n=1 Tax=Corynebacterium alimapuense TaxID=1576874 RepID=A0A3M8K7Y9_9CORY|nr:hypothetical protein [Corynebacterium alimapuense]RNE48979.1 hypothetical protein C5L39_06765 [Corynebacterium alimapuense]
MSSNNFAVADQSSESFPNYAPKIHDSYIEGYEPSSLNAGHSSLERSSTWIGMGLLLSALVGIGIIIWVAATSLWGQGVTVAEYNLNLYLWIGIVIAAVLGAAGFGLIYYGRRNYREYRKTTGRSN